MARASERRSPISFLQAIVALLLALVLFAVYGLVATQTEDGWLRDFALAAVPGAAVVAASYALAYSLLFRHGLTRDQQLADVVSTRVAERLGRAGPVKGFFVGGASPDWDGSLDESDHVFAAARSLARWSSEMDAAIRRLFARGGTLTVVSHDPQDYAGLALAAAHHGGYGDTTDPERVRGNIITALRRLEASASASAPAGTDALRVFTTRTHGFVHAVGLLRVLVEWAATHGRTPCTREHPRCSHFRPDCRARSPAGRSPAFVHFSEMEGLQRISTPVPAADLAAVVGR